MTSKLDEISEAIGALRSDFRSLDKKIDASDAVAKENTRRADEHRATIHRRVDELVDEVGGLNSKVEVMDTSLKDTQATLKDTKAVTDEVRAWKQRGVGALFVTGIASAALSGTIVAFLAYWWDAILRVLQKG